MPVFNPWNTFSNTGANAFGSYVNAFGNYAGNAASAGAQRDVGLANAGVSQLNNQLNAFVQDKGNLLNRQSAYERNFLDHDLGLKTNDTNRYNIDTGRQNLLDQIASTDKNTALTDYTNRFGIQAGYDSNLFNSLSSLAGNRYASDRQTQAALGTAALNAQSNMLAPMLQQQRFASLAPSILGALGSIGRGSSNLSNAIMGAK